MPPARRCIRDEAWRVRAAGRKFASFAADIVKRTGKSERSIERDAIRAKARGSDLSGRHLAVIIRNMIRHAMSHASISRSRPVAEPRLSSEPSGARGRLPETRSSALSSGWISQSMRMPTSPWMMRPAMLMPTPNPLGSFDRLSNQIYAWKPTTAYGTGYAVDCELDQSDAEPSLGSIEDHPNGYCDASDFDGIGRSQALRASGDTRDLEAVGGVL
jgi:hypothetical protein